MDFNSAVKILSQHHGISRREEDVVKLVCEGLSNHTIGERLEITVKTVKFHMTNILKKTALKSRGQLAARVYEATKVVTN